MGIIWSYCARGEEPIVSPEIALAKKKSSKKMLNVDDFVDVEYPREKLPEIGAGEYYWRESSSSETCYSGSETEMLTELEYYAASGEARSITKDFWNPDKEDYYDWDVSYSDSVLGQETYPKPLHEMTGFVEVHRAEDSGWETSLSFTSSDSELLSNTPPKQKSSSTIGLNRLYSWSSSSATSCTEISEPQLTTELAPKKEDSSSIDLNRLYSSWSSSSVTSCTDISEPQLAPKKKENNGPRRSLSLPEQEILWNKRSFPLKVAEGSFQTRKSRTSSSVRKERSKLIKSKENIRPPNSPSSPEHESLKNKKSCQLKAEEEKDEPKKKLKRAKSKLNESKESLQPKKRHLSIKKGIVQPRKSHPSPSVSKETCQPRKGQSLTKKDTLLAKTTQPSPKEDTPLPKTTQPSPKEESFQSKKSVSLVKKDTIPLKRCDVLVTEGVKGRGKDAVNVKRCLSEALNESANAATRGSGDSLTMVSDPSLCPARRSAILHGDDYQSIVDFPGLEDQTVGERKAVDVKANSSARKETSPEKGAPKENPPSPTSPQKNSTSTKANPSNTSGSVKQNPTTTSTSVNENQPKKSTNNLPQKCMSVKESQPKVNSQKYNPKQSSTQKNSPTNNSAAKNPQTKNLTTPSKNAPTKSLLPQNPPTKSNSTKIPSTQNTSTKNVPTKSLSTQNPPAKNAVTKILSPQNPPTKNTSTKTLPTKTPPTQNTSTKTLLTKTPPTQNTSTKTLPTKPPLTQNTSTKNVPTKSVPTQNPPSKNAVTKSVSSQNPQTKNISTKTLPTKPPLTQNTPTKNVPIKSLSTQIPPTKNTPTKNLPTQNSTTKSLPTQNIPEKMPSSKNVPIKNPSTKTLPAQNPPPKIPPSKNASIQNLSKNPPPKNSPSKNCLPKIPASESPAPKSPAPKSPAPKSPAPKSPAPKSPAPKSPAPLSPAPKSPTSKSPTKSPTSKSPASKSPCKNPVNIKENVAKGKQMKYTEWDYFEDESSDSEPGSPLQLYFSKEVGLNSVGSSETDLGAAAATAHGKKEKKQILEKENRALNKLHSLQDFGIDYTDMHTTIDPIGQPLPKSHEPWEEIYGSFSSVKSKNSWEPAPDDAASRCMLELKEKIAEIKRKNDAKEAGSGNVMVQYPSQYVELSKEKNLLTYPKFFPTNSESSRMNEPIGAMYREYNPETSQYALAPVRRMHDYGETPPNYRGKSFNNMSETRNQAYPEYPPEYMRGSAPAMRNYGPKSSYTPADTRMRHSVEDVYGDCRSRHSRAGRSVDETSFSMTSTLPDRNRNRPKSARSRDSRTSSIPPDKIRKWPTVISPPPKRHETQKDFPTCPMAGINVMGIHIQLHEFETLRDPSNVNEKVIIAYLKLEARYSKTFILERHVIESWWKSLNLLPSVRLSDYDKLIGPFDPIRMRFGARGNWLLFYANVRHGTVCVLDSTCSANDNRHYEQFMYFKEFWKRKREPPIEWVEDKIRCGVQTDNVSDGMFCMLHALCLIRGEKPSSVKQKNIPKFRLHIANKLLRNDDWHGALI